MRLQRLVFDYRTGELVVRYLFVAAVHDGHRALYRAAGVAFFVFVLVAAVFFLRTL